MLFMKLKKLLNSLGPKSRQFWKPICLNLQQISLTPLQLNFEHCEKYKNRITLMYSTVHVQCAKLKYLHYVHIPRLKHNIGITYFAQNSQKRQYRHAANSADKLAATHHQSVQSLLQNYKKYTQIKTASAFEVGELGTPSTNNRGTHPTNNYKYFIYIFIQYICYIIYSRL